MSQENQKKIAVLGGGMGSLSTVWALTSEPNWQEHYDITVYQLGWRLGGKGASGRSVKPYADNLDQAPNDRVEEHGLHIFFGFYENAFRIMKECYEALEDDGPFKSITDAFKPHNFVVLYNEHNGDWDPWRFDFPKNNLLPWEKNRTTNLWQHVISALKLVYRVWENSEILGTAQPPNPDGCCVDAFFKQTYRNLEALGLVSNTWLAHLSEESMRSSGNSFLEDPQQWMDQMGSIGEQVEKMSQTTAFNSEVVYLHLAKELADSLPENMHYHRKEHCNVLIALIERFMAELEDCWHDKLQISADLRRELIIINYGLASIRAVLGSGVLFEPSLDVLDQYDYGEWLQSYGAWDETLRSPMVRSIYDLTYSYELGDIRLPRMAAGVALRVVINIFFRYKGSVMWKMQAGMGDTIFAPLYTVLKQRGVKFEFFHRVKALHLSADQSSIERIDISRQVTLKPNTTYDPLIRVKDLLCWPSEPRYEQIDPTQADALQANNIDLESFWTPWQDVDPDLTLTARTDDNPDGEFDQVLLGISLAALPFLCEELTQANKTATALAASQKWRDMFAKVKTVTTQGEQLWLKPTLSELGWTMPSAVVTTYTEPLDTYADMTQLLPQENWPGASSPQNLAYFTGVIRDPGIPDADEHTFPAVAQAEFEQKFQAFLDNDIGVLWPDATYPNSPALDESLVVSKYVRINISPTERYVMAAPDSTAYRLEAGGSGFDNLYLTGDWLRNGFNAGAIEPTVISGLQAARAMMAREGRSLTEDIRGEETGWL